eukprot:473761-Pelagomonas_calceolata.AAC.1
MLSFEGIPSKAFLDIPACTASWPYVVSQLAQFWWSTIPQVCVERSADLRSRQLCVERSADRSAVQTAVREQLMWLKE